MPELQFDGADLSNLNLSGADVRSSDMNGTNLNGAKLGNSRMDSVYANDVKLVNADLNGAVASWRRIGDALYIFTFPLSSQI